ncbi:hypothetical protein QC764_408455 [Podospora pseudoanserina]|uniref:Uncharacterized protein n=1 Tax=Podospora pseudoanserina TaxID=2609844 RepID=A0ABR0IB35_9PEZI|nr:hypothetical protein QC764_408455 [Podospora pseudoanserina]
MDATAPVAPSPSSNIEHPGHEVHTTTGNLPVVTPTSATTTSSTPAPKAAPSPTVSTLRLTTPPMETKPIDFGDIYEITIPQDIATRNFNDLENEGRPHVVICYMDNKPNNTFVAKIYDGFNGSFTFEVETHVPERTARWVRMVLMDHYKGVETMEEKIARARTIDGTVDHGRLPDEKTRLDILRKVSEASHKMWWNVEIGINALGPGKVLILSDGSVKLFGFTCAFVYRWVDQNVFAHPNHGGDRSMMGLPAERLKPESPIIRCWPDRGTGALGPEGALRRWVPER